MAVREALGIGIPRPIRGGAPCGDWQDAKTVSDPRALGNRQRSDPHLSNDDRGAMARVGARDGGRTRSRWICASDSRRGTCSYWNAPPPACV